MNHQAWVNILSVLCDEVTLGGSRKSTGNDSRPLFMS